MEKLKSLLAKPVGRLFVLTDKNVERLVIPVLTNEVVALAPLPRLAISAGEENKNLQGICRIWEWLLANSATRSDTLICIGGGMVTDMGGFAAATFKRGMHYVNIATTLLAAADASIGGKTGFDFDGVKNCIGAFAMPLFTEVYAPAFATLPESGLLSGYGEMLKTAMIGNRELLDELMNWESLKNNLPRLGEIASECGRIKAQIADSDPLEKGPRKVLNLGHTFGHAFESLYINTPTPVPHGVAVVHGLLVMLVIARLNGSKSGLLYILAERVVKPLMKVAPLRCNQYDRLLELMHADKKNDADGRVKFVLLTDDFRSRIGVPVDDDTLKAAFDIYNDLLGQ